MHTFFGLKNIHKIIFFGMLIFLQGCTFFGLYQNAYNSTLEYFNPRSINITPHIKNLPYAMQIVEHKGESVIMVLSNASNQHLDWVDSENNGLITFNGKIIASHGLSNNLATIQSPNIKSIFEELKKNPDNEIKKNSWIRFLNPETSYLNASHVFRILNSDPKDYFKRKIDGKLISYSILEERVEVSNINWKYTNTYWFDDNGKVFKSKQYITPDQSKYFLETLKAYAPKE